MWARKTQAAPGSGNVGKGKRVEPPIAYECKASSHQVGEGGPDKLTVHQGKWAFCPFDVKAADHEWMATGGLPLSMLRHGAVLRVRDKSEVT